MHNKILIIAGGNAPSEALVRRFLQESTILCAVDSGMHVFGRISVNPDYLIGDFDSVDGEILEKVRAKGATKIQDTVDQNKTDLQKALDFLDDLYPDADINILGALGGRMDHMLGNILSLMPFQSPSRIALYDEENEIRLLDDCYSFSGAEGDVVGVFPIKQTRNLRYKGLAYDVIPLKDNVFPVGWIGSCNTMLGQSAKIMFDEGLVVFTKTFS